MATSGEPVAASESRRALGDLAPGLIWAYRIDPARCVDVRPLPAREMFRDDGGEAWWWLHFDLVDRRAAATLGQLLAASRFGLSAPIVDAFLRSTVGPELHFTQGVVHGALLDRVIDIDGVKDEQALLNVVCARHLLITGRRMHLRGVNWLHTQARENRLHGTPSALLDQLGRLAASEHARELEQAARTLDQFEDRVLTESRDLQRGEIIRLRHRMVRLHRELAGLLRLYDRADQEIRLETTRQPAGVQGEDGYDADWIDFGSLVQHLQNLDGLCLASHDRARLLQEEVSDQLTVQTNRQLYVLSILTAVLVPPTIVVGVFGMNTGGLPLTDRPSGFGIAMLLCVASSLLVIGIMVLAGVIALPGWVRRRFVRWRSGGLQRHAALSGGGSWGALVDPAATRHDES